MSKNPLKALLIFATTSLAFSTALAETPQVYDPPGLTTWTPEGCRLVPSSNPILPDRNGWHYAHADTVNTDEVEIALAPVFEPSWIAEPNTFIASGSTFDDEGHLFVSPIFPIEDIIVLSINRDDGSRNFAIPNTTGAPPGAHAPLVLDDPDHPGKKIIYLSVYDRTVAFRSDGSIVWDVPTGLTQHDDPFKMLVFGLNYLPAHDALVGITYDGYVFVLDRSTGQQLLEEPFNLPGERSPTARPLTLPQSAIDAADEVLFTMLSLPDGRGVADLRNVLLGNEAEVANNFSIDPHTSRIWLAATAPDEEDGTVDGVSEYGALYSYDLVFDGAEYGLVQQSARYFQGGSASTPSLGADGKRVYLADNDNVLLAINSDGTDAWQVETSAQVYGSVAVSSDNGEIYISSRDGIILKVVDEGDYGDVEWTVNLDAYQDLSPSQANISLNLVSIGANALFVQTGVGIFAGNTVLAQRTGIAQVDRETGQIRYFADGLEESVAVMNTGPDGVVYMSHGPLRRLFAYALGEAGVLPQVEPPIGGVRKWAPTRLDLLARDAIAAAADRANNAYEHRRVCPDSARYDVKQIGLLLEQASDAGRQAVADGDLTPLEWWRVGARMVAARILLAIPHFKLKYLKHVGDFLEGALDQFPAE